jgi:hypothetical protein
MPFEQMRCHIVLSDEGMLLSAMSGVAMKENKVFVSWQDQAPEPLGIFGVLIIKSAQDIWQTMQLLPSTSTMGAEYGRYLVHAVSSQRMLFVVKSPADLFCDDLEIRLSEQGNPISITYIQATDTSERLHATRQIWLLNK